MKKTILLLFLILLVGVVTVLAEDNVTNSTINGSVVNVFGTDYQVGDTGTIFVQHLSAGGTPYSSTRSCCEIRVYYPSDAFWQGINMWSSGVYLENGIWDYDFTIPNTIGIYQVVGKCWSKTDGATCSATEPADSSCGGADAFYGTCSFGVNEINVRNYTFGLTYLDLQHLLNETHIVKNYSIEGYENTETIKNTTTEIYGQTTTIFSRVEGIWNGTTSWILRLLGLAEDTNTTLHDFQQETNDTLTLPQVHFITN
jgi:hypothetical protein